LGKVRKKLEMMKGQETGKKKDDKDDPRRGRKFRRLRIDGGR